MVRIFHCSVWLVRYSVISAIRKHTSVKRFSDSALVRPANLSLSQRSRPSVPLKLLPAGRRLFISETRARPTLVFTRRASTSSWVITKSKAIRKLGTRHGIKRQPSSPAVFLFMWCLVFGNHKTMTITHNAMTSSHSVMPNPEKQPSVLCPPLHTV